MQFVKTFYKKEAQIYSEGKQDIIGFCFSQELWKKNERSTLEAQSESTTAVQNENCTEHKNPPKPLSLERR